MNESGPPGYAVEFEIEELALYGFAPTERYRIGDAVRQELERLFQENGLPFSPEQDLYLHRLQAQTFEFGVDTPAEIIGRQIARSIYQGFSR